MGKAKWTKYYRARKGYPAKFACVSHPNGIDLTNENIPTEVIKKLYDKGIKNVEKIEPDKKNQATT